MARPLVSAEQPHVTGGSVTPEAPGARIDDRDIDDVLDESFPASDPPSWWAGADRATTRPPEPEAPVVGWPDG